MIYNFVLAYDRVNDTDPLNIILIAILNADADPDDIRPVLNTTIEFDLNIEKGEELDFVINRILREIADRAYVKIYYYKQAWGKGKIYNPLSSTEDNSRIGKSFKTALTTAKLMKKSFRNEF